MIAPTMLARMIQGYHISIRRITGLCFRIFMIITLLARECKIILRRGSTCMMWNDMFYRKIIRRELFRASTIFTEFPSSLCDDAPHFGRDALLHTGNG